MSVSFKYFTYRAGIKACFIIFFTLAIMSCSSVVRFSSSTDASGEGKTGSKTGETLPAGTVLMGKASYYGNEFHGRTTANGEIYDMYKISAAHKTLAFGTMVKVRNLNNNKEIVVRINDRGPFVSGRIIDLSLAAAKELDMLRDGVVDVELVILD